MKDVHERLFAASAGYRKFLADLNEENDDEDAESLVRAFADWAVGWERPEEYADRDAAYFQSQWEHWND